MVDRIYQQLLSNIKNGEYTNFPILKNGSSTWPTEAKIVGLTEAPRGALAHWIVIKDKKIDNYQLVYFEALGMLLHPRSKKDRCLLMNLR